MWSRQTWMRTAACWAVPASSSSNRKKKTVVHQNHGFLLSLPPDGSFTHPDHVTIDTVRRYLYVYISVKASLDLLCFPSRSYQEHDPLFPSHGLLCSRAYFRILSYMSKLTFLCHLPTKSSISHFQEILGISWSEAYEINAGGYGIQEAWPFQCFYPANETVWIPQTILISIQRCRSASCFTWSKKSSDFLRKSWSLPYR